MICLALGSAWLAGCSATELPAPEVPRAETAAPADYRRLLKQYATPHGVRYAAWHQNQEDLAALDQVVEFYAASQPPSDSDAALAWYLNAYNAWILHNILEKYPTKGPLAGSPLFFHGKNLELSGRRMSFDHLEQTIIRKKFDEPRIHFALNCASESCPPLLTRPFAGPTLAEDLQRLTVRFINHNPQGVVPRGNTIKLSKIFDWYAEDFGGRDGLLDYINQYQEQPIDPDKKVEFLDYSWDLNEAEA